MKLPRYLILAGTNCEIVRRDRVNWTHERTLEPHGFDCLFKVEKKTYLFEYGNYIVRVRRKAVIDTRCRMQ